MLLLILKSSACLAVFMLFYKLFLEKESIHQFKRFYLLGALLVSIVIPFITFTQYIEVEPIQDFVPFQPFEFSNTDTFTPETTWQDYFPTILWSIYFLGVILFSFRFALNLKAIFHRIKTNPKHQYHEFTNVLIQDLIHPHTFFKYIFLNKTKYEHKLIPNEVLLHEQTHAKQKHALDILCIEVLQIIFWFNPLLYFIKKDIKLNHEFLADQAVLQKGFDATQYKQTLLAFSSPDSYRDANETPLANAINYSLIKKRFTVMKSKTSKQAFWLRSLLLLPILAILIYSFSQKEIVEKEVALVELETQQQNQDLTTKTKLYNYLIEKRKEAEETLNESKTKDSTELKLLEGRIDIIKKDIDKLINVSSNSIKERLNELQQQVKTDKGATEAMMNEYRTFIEEFENSNTIWAPKLNRAIAIYDLMTEVQRATVKKYPKTPSINLASIKPKSPSKTEFNSWKNSAKFAIWIDGKNVSNKSLNNYKSSDITYFTVSKVYKNAQTKKHPQPFQNNLYTKKGYEEAYLKSNVKRYNSLKKDYQSAQKTLNQGDSELRILKARLDRAYKALTKEEIKKYKVEKIKFPISSVQQKATKEQIAEYNKLAKKYSALLKSEDDLIIKQSEIDKVNYLYNLIPIDQRENTEPFPRFPSHPPIQEIATKEQLAEYNKLAKKISSQPEGKQIIKVKGLKYLYSLMSAQQKKNANPFPKIAPMPPLPAMDTIYTYNSRAKRAKFIPANRKNNLQSLKILFNKMSSSQREKVESPNSISKYIAQLDNLTVEQVKKVNEVYNKIKARAQSKGRKFYSAEEYKELEELYNSMIH